MSSTIIALSTGEGESAIALVRLSGPESIKVTDELFKGAVLAEEESHTIHYGLILDGENTLDDVVVAIYKGPNSYTGEDVVEISCHGSSYIVKRMIELFAEHGIVPAKPGEFTERAFLNGKMDLSQAEAVADLIASNSKAAHDLAINQMRGGYSEEIKKLRQQIMDFASLIELELDFGEEDVEFADRTELLRLIGSVREILQGLIESYEYGNVLKQGIPVTIAGPPNAGKSTILNYLLKEEKALVSDIAGTTRDVIEDVVNWGGIAYRFIDTAGIRSTEDQLEAMGIERSHDRLNKSEVGPCSCGSRYGSR